MLRRNLGDTLRRKGCDDSFLRYKMLRRNPSGVLRRKVPWTLHFSAFLVVRYKEFGELIQPFKDPEQVSQLDRKLLKTTGLDCSSFLGTLP
ncbi:hypothetical protein Tco_0722396 [Tanacetum coccineum]